MSTADETALIYRSVNTCSDLRERTGEKVEVLVSLCEKAHRRGHQVLVVVRVLVASNGLKEPSCFFCSEGFPHIGQEGGLDFTLWSRT